MAKTTLAAVLMAVGAALASRGAMPAAAQPAAGKNSMATGRSACLPDKLKFCKDVQGGAGRIRACLKQHTNQLSPGCQQELAKEAQAGAPGPAGHWGGPCMSDIATYCKDIPPGGGQVRACLERRMPALSEPCRTALQPKKAN
jgi:hypothetical protein